MKRDPYNHERRYLAWKARTQPGISGVTTADAAMLQRFLEDMERGLNVAAGSKKGPRSYIRLNMVRTRLTFLLRHFAERFALACVTEITEEQLHEFFTGMATGRIRKADGGVYLSTADYVKVFKTFWHWHMKVEKKCEIRIPDICEDLDTRRDKPRWVYLTEAQVGRLCDHAKREYRVLMMFMFDAGIRSPSELVNLRVSDVLDQGRRLSIRDEASKTFGRVINLMLCPRLLQEYIAEKGLSDDDYLFSICPAVVNRYLKRLAARVLGPGKSRAGKPYSELTMYDFRHSSACYWMARYKSEAALQYRFGWKKSDMIHYYTEFLGMKDTITQDDLLVDDAKTDIERRLEQSERSRHVLEERLQAMEDQMARILQATEKIVSTAA